MTTPILVLGAGSWGTALSIHLARNHQEVWLWSHEPDVVDAINQKRENIRYLPGEKLPAKIKAIDHLDSFFKTYQEEPHDVMLAIPSFVFDEVLDKLEAYKNQKTRLLWVTKGLSERGGLLHETVLARGFKVFGVLSGPSFAKEVAKDLPTSVTLACEDDKFAKDLIQRFHTPHFRVYRSDDIIGVQLGGALKNVLAIAVSLVDGLGYGMNVKAAMMTRGLYELSQLAVAMGANKETLFGLSGMGDIILTCSDNQSRNRRFGLNLAKGLDADEAERQVGQVVEGRRNTLQAYQLFKQHEVPAPICQMVYSILYEHVPAKVAIKKRFDEAPGLEF